MSIIQVQCLPILLDMMEKFLDQYSHYGSKEHKHAQLNWQLKKFRNTIQKHLDELCSYFDLMMMDEPNLVRLPFTNWTYYFFGDLHGSLSDVCLIRNKFLRRSLVDQHFIFLGDYVDRGIHGFEVFIYLLMLKLTYPNNFTILRGNHEFSNMNDVSFLPELQYKFGYEAGWKIWNRLNVSFSMLPYAGLVVDNIFCCHGGIPKNLRSMDEIEQIPKQIMVIEEKDENGIAFQLIWNDFYTSNMELHKEPKLFNKNLLRGCGYVIGPKGISKFFQRFNLNYIVRAHDFSICERYGYDEFQVKNVGTVFTLFSNSSYMETINNTCCLKINWQQGLVQILPLVTCEQPLEFFNKSELIEDEPRLIEMKFKDPYQSTLGQTEELANLNQEQPPRFPTSSRQQRKRKKSKLFRPR